MTDRQCLFPPLSRAVWQAAHNAATRALPHLLARGLLEDAARLSRRARQFAERAASEAA